MPPKAPGPQHTPETKKRDKAVWDMIAGSSKALFCCRLFVCFFRLFFIFLVYFVFVFSSSFLLLLVLVFLFPLFILLLSVLVFELGGGGGEVRIHVTHGCSQTPL